MFYLQSAQKQVKITIKYLFIYLILRPHVRVPGTRLKTIMIDTTTSNGNGRRVM